MSVVGIEPTTNGLKGHCSAIELHARLRREFYHGAGGKSTFVKGSSATRPKTEDRSCDWESI